MVDEEMGMPAKRELSMQQQRHLLRLHHDGVSAREIGRRLSVARSTIQDSLKRAAAAGLVWPLAEGVTDDVLEQLLFGGAGVATGQRRRVEPDWAALARELKRPGVTMQILWEECREVQPGDYGYSRFCDLLRGFERRLAPVMRQRHVAGDKAFVDYSGKRIGIADPSTAEIREAEIFVGVLGASNLTYAEATWTQQLADWRFSIAASASGSISAATWAASTARTSTICPVPTGVMPSGRQIGSAVGPARSRRTPKA
jgi:transposase